MISPQHPVVIIGLGAAMDECVPFIVDAGSIALWNTILSDSGRGDWSESFR
jgi:hypothetical protein